MRKIVLLLLILLQCIETSVAQEHMRDFKKMQSGEICRILNENHYVQIDLDIPMFSPSLQKYLSQKMFGSDEESLPGAVNRFLQNHALENESAIDGLSKDSRMVFQLSRVSYNPGKYVTYYMKYPVFNASGVTVEVSSFIYDLIHEKVLTYDDVFAKQDPILNLFKAPKEDYLFELDDDYLSCGTMSEAKFTRLPLFLLKESFSPQFKQLVDWEKVEARADSLKLDEKYLGEQHAREAKAQKSRYNEAVMELELENEKMAEMYLADKKPYKDIHLYMHNGACWVSGINKDITELNDADYALLEKKGKQVLPEIEVMKEWLLTRNADSRTDVFYYLIDPVDEVLLHLSDYQSLPFISYSDKYHTIIQDHVRTHLSLKYETLKTRVILFLSKDATMLCPVVLEGQDIEANKEILKILRRNKKWKFLFAVDDERPIRICMSEVFSFKKIVTHTTRTISIPVPRGHR